MLRVSRSKVDRLSTHDCPDLPPAPLMDPGLAISGSLARRRRPLIGFLSIGPRVCSMLLSDPASRRRPCASLLLLLHQDVKRTFTSMLSNMFGTPPEEPRDAGLYEEASIRRSRCVYFFSGFSSLASWVAALWLAVETASMKGAAEAGGVISPVRILRNGTSLP